MNFKIIESRNTSINIQELSDLKAVPKRASATFEIVHRKLQLTMLFRAGYDPETDTLYLSYVSDQ